MIWWRGGSGSREAAVSGGEANEDIRQAAALAGLRESEIRPSTGGVHVVYHATTGLPTPAQPRADGKVTLLWFGATW